VPWRLVARGDDPFLISGHPDEWARQCGEHGENSFHKLDAVSLGPSETLGIGRKSRARLLEQLGQRDPTEGELETEHDPPESDHGFAAVLDFHVQLDDRVDHRKAEAGDRDDADVVEEIQAADGKLVVASPPRVKNGHECQDKATTHDVDAEVYTEFMEPFQVGRWGSHPQSPLR